MQNGLAKETSSGVAQCRRAEVRSIWVCHLVLVKGDFAQQKALMLILLSKLFAFA